MKINPEEVVEKTELMSALSGILRESANIALLGAPTVKRNYSITGKYHKKKCQSKMSTKMFCRSICG